MKPLPKVDHPLHTLILNRWSPRSFADKPLTEENVLTLFEAARYAASMNNFQPWRFIYATKEQTGRYKKLFECLKEGNRKWAVTAPLLVLTLINVNMPNTDKPNLWAKHDLGLAIGNLTAQASSMNLYVHNMAGFEKETAAKLFNLPPDFEPVTMIAIGYLGDPEALPEPFRGRELLAQERKPLAEIILNDRF
jgi:nitroreductase